MTRLYLDVDGVVNMSYISHPDWDSFQSGKAMGYTIRWSPAMLEELGALGLDLYWTTTWRDWAPQKIGGLTGFGQGAPVVHPISGESRFPSIDWKFESLIAIQTADPGPFVWIDDEIEFSHAQWANSVGGLAIAPEYKFGIRKRDIEAIHDYLEVINGNHAE